MQILYGRHQIHPRMYIFGQKTATVVGASVGKDSFISVGMFSFATLGPLNLLEWDKPLKRAFVFVAALSMFTLKANFEKLDIKELAKEEW